MTPWFAWALAAAVLYGLHQIFTKLAASRIGDGIGAFVVEASATLTILGYLAALRLSGRWQQPVTGAGVAYAVITGICVGAGTVAFFFLFQKGAPLSSVPAVLAAGSALMAFAGIVAFKEPPSLSRLLGIALSLAGLLLLRR